MKPTRSQRVRYQFDNLMSRGTPVLIGILFLLSLLIVTLAAAVISLAQFVQEGQTGSLTFGEAAWESLMRTLDSGTMDGDTGTGFRAPVRAPPLVPQIRWKVLFSDSYSDVKLSLQPHIPDLRR